MNKTLETVRGSWLTRDREAAEANRVILHNALDQIPASVREKLLPVLEWTDGIEALSDILLDVSVKYEEQKINEIVFLDAQIKRLIDAIRQTKDIDSIRQLRTVARDTIEQIRDHKLREEQKRLADELASRNPVTSPIAVETAPR
jgi:hypothetical protein